MQSNRKPAIMAAQSVTYAIKGTVPLRNEQIKKKTIFASNEVST